MRSSVALQEGKVYTRDDLRVLFDISDATINNGVFRPKGHNSIWIFVTEQKTADRTPYLDSLEGDVLRWEGQTTGLTDRLIIEHAERGLELVVFFRRRKYEHPHAAFRYLGRFRYESHQNTRPTRFTLRREATDDSCPAAKQADMAAAASAAPTELVSASAPEARIGAILGGHTRSVSVDGPLTKRLPDVLAGRPEDVPEVIRKARRVVECLPDPYGAPKQTIGLMLGRIQAGKTNGMIAATAVAVDNGYKVIIVLTSDNTWLYEQTLDRFKSALPSLTCAGYTEWSGKKSLISSVLKLPTGGVVLVTTKNGTRLKALCHFLSEMHMEDLPALVFDDEADQASLDANAGKPGAPPTPINSLITQLRSIFLITGFVQVTATPQALLLLDKDSEYRPKFSVVLEPGSEYIGADVYFADGSPYLVDVPLGEVGDLKAKDGGKQLPLGLRRALCTFFVAATCKLVTAKEQPYSCLIHVSLNTEHHNRIGDLVSQFVIEVANELAGGHTTRNAAIREDLARAYNDLKAPGADLPLLEDVFLYLGNMVQGTDIQVLNSKNAEKQARYSARYNILVGGTKLGRGVTIKGLLVTYYGRESKTPQMDTVQQHARMYGYRRSDLPFTRIFLPNELARYFREINVSENELRAWLQTLPDTTFDPQIIPNGMRATRSQVLNPNTVGCYVPGKAYTPALTAFADFADVPVTEVLDRQLTIPKRGDCASRLVTIEEIRGILQRIRTNSRSLAGWEDQRIIASLTVLERLYGSSAHLVVFAHRRLALREKPNVASSGDLARVSRNLPTLFMFRQEGLVEDGWTGVPFWIPVFRFPEGPHPIAFNFS